MAAGDEITGVNGRSIKGKTKVEVAKMIQEVKVRAAGSGALHQERHFGGPAGLARRPAYRCPLLRASGSGSPLAFSSLAQWALIALQDLGWALARGGHQEPKVLELQSASRLRTGFRARGVPSQSRS